MAIGLGSSNTTRYFTGSDHADFTLPNSDWALLFFVKRQSSSSYLWSNGAYGVGNTCNFFFFNDFLTINVNGTERNLNLSGIWSSGEWGLAFARRLSGNVRCGFVKPGDSAVTTGLLTSLSASSDGANLAICGRYDGNSSWMFDGDFGWCSLVDGTVSDDTMVAVGNGQPIIETSVASGIKTLWHGRSASEIVPLIAGHTLTMNGASYTSVDDLFLPYPGQILAPFDFGGGGITLSVDDMVQGQQSDSVLLTQAHQLSVSDSSQPQSSDNIDLLSGYLLVVPDSLQAQSSDNLALIQSHTLTIADSSQSQSFDGVILSVSVVLALQETGQLQLSDNIDLIQNNVLSLQDTAQSQTMGNITLATGILLVVADGYQSQLSDNIALTQAHTLPVSDSMQTQSSDAFSLIQSYILSVSDTEQSQGIDNITLSLSVVLNPDDMFQNQLVGGIALTQANILALQDILQSQHADGIVLTQGSIIAVASMSQSQSMDNIDWIVIVTPGERIYVINAENRVYLIN